MSTLASLLPMIMAPKSRQARGDCQYTPQELAVLNKHKAAYRKTTTHAQRDQMMRTKIYVDIFNYWDDIGIPLDETVTNRRMKVCISIL